MGLELQVILGLNCNFFCSHCLNDSKPKRKDFDISQNELESLSKQIIENKDIFQVSFSGGEPLLYLDEIKFLVDSIRSSPRHIHFSITTNGALIKNKYRQIKSLDLDSCLISYDEEHSMFLSKIDFEESIDLAKSLFKEVELNITFETENYFRDVSQSVEKSNTKVNFTSKINSGRASKKLPNNEQSKFQLFKCPNIDEKKKFYKITFIPTKGFTICCGPVIFDKLLGDELLYFNSVAELNNNIFYKFIKKLSTSTVYAVSEINCDNCKFICADSNYDSILKFSQRPWENIIFNYTEDELKKYNNLFYPKFVKILETKEIINPWKDIIESTELIKSFKGDILSLVDIEKFTEFTLDSFYKVHTKFYSSSDIIRFKNEQSIFFNMPYRYIYHTKNDEIVAYLVLCNWEKHPFFKKDVWHIGYWGIGNQIALRTERDYIKKEWATLLSELNSNSSITANIDFFNYPADSISAKLNFKSIGLRLDPRS